MRDDISVHADDAPLDARLLARIQREGRLTFRDWMAAALYDERGGYYSRSDLERWGRAGDYRTAPERTPLFAATFARHFKRLYEELGSPNSFTLIEAGGGAGRFTRVALDTLRRDAREVFDSLRYVFDEASPDARARAAALLAPHAERVEFRSIRDLTVEARNVNAASQNPAPQPGAFVIFSNELLDALPVHRVVMRAGSLRELYVVEDVRGGFAWEEGEPSTPRLAEHFARFGVTLGEGQFAEVNLEAEEWVARVASLEGDGFVVTVDYGDDARALADAPHRREGTLRAFSGHRFVEDPLANPGAQDLTTTVNWTQVVAAGERAGLKTVALERLDSFLLNAGLLEQLERESALARDEAERSALRLGAREMILPGGMAVSFQVLVQKKAR
ncbi:MAG TPA: SAM-dependent methyltransferase [Pyrinomonadaceae bacterium]|nr:SAM-dependent methyltransferase [Pyrinomonadaceae bacterium]